MARLMQASALASADRPWRHDAEPLGPRGQALHDPGIERETAIQRLPPVGESALAHDPLELPQVPLPFARKVRWETNNKLLLGYGPT